MLPAKAVVRPAVRRVAARRLERRRPRPPAPRGSARPSAARSRRPSARPIIVQTVSAKASMLEPAGEDVEQAARGGDGDGAEAERDRRGDRRAEDEQEDDAAGSAARSARCARRRRSTRPGSRARGSRSRSGSPLTGGWICSSRIASSSSTESLTASARPTWKSTTISARRGLGPQPPDRAAVPGRERGHPRVAGAQGADQLRALAVDRRAPGRAGGPRTAPSRRSARAGSALAFEDGVPGMSSEVGLSRLVDAGAERRARTASDQGGDGQHRARVAQQQTRSLP